MNFGQPHFNKEGSAPNLHFPFLKKIMLVSLCTQNAQCIVRLSYLIMFLQLDVCGVNIKCCTSPPALSPANIQPIPLVCCCCACVGVGVLLYWSSVHKCSFILRLSICWFLWYLYQVKETNVTPDKGQHIHVDLYT